MIPLIQLLHLYWFWQLDFIPPAEFFVYPYLTTRGLVPYMQIIDHHFPGLFFLPINFFTLGFTTPLGFKVLQLLIILLTSVFLSRLTFLKSQSRFTACLAVSLYSLWQLFFSGSLLWIDIFLPVFMLPGLILFEKRKYLASGLLFALAVVFKQTAILPLFFLSLYLLKSVKNLLSFWFPTLLVLLLLVLYFLKLGALRDFLWWNIVFNFQIYPITASAWPEFRDWLTISLPLFLYFGSTWQTLRSHSGFGLKLAGLTGVLAIPAFSRFGLEHFQSALPFFCVLVALATTYHKRLWLPVLLLSFIWTGFFIIRTHPTSKVINFSPSDLILYDQVSKLSTSGNSVYALGASPIIYSQSQLIPPGKLLFFPLPWLFLQLENRELNTLQTSSPDYVIFNPQSRVDSVDIFTSAPTLVEYIHTHYFIEATVSGQLIYHRI
jgi:hypothetical protein